VIGICGIRVLHVTVSDDAKNTRDNDDPLCR
jgi:hypothetical protein